MEEITKTVLPDLPRRPPLPPVASGFKPSAELTGTWTGQVHTPRAPVNLTLEIKTDGDVHARLGTQLQTLLNRVALRDGYLTGTMMGDIGTEDASRTPHTLGLTLKLRGSVLVGGITAMSLPGRRVGNALTHWVELRKE
jgi:hypothetical protein